MGNALMAIAIFLGVAITLFLREDSSRNIDKIVAILASLLLLLSYRKIAELSRFSLMARLASDYESENAAWPYEVVLWVLFLLFCGIALFG